MSEEALMYSTMGELIQNYRKQADLKLSHLAQLTGVSKGVISKIENGDTKRPELKTVLPLAKTLNIPTVTIIEYYIEVNSRPEVLRELLMEAIRLDELPLVTKVALRFLQTSYEQSEIQIERLYDLVSSLSDKKFQVPLYDVIIKYARERGMQRFLAKGLLQKFLIEMYDLKKLEESFRLGEEVLYYTDFLSKAERINFYYQMVFQAHDMKKYVRCIEFAKMGHAEDPTQSELKERVALAICNSYYRMGKYEELEEHLSLYEGLGYQFIIDRVKYYRAVILSKRGQYDVALPLLKESVEEATEKNRLHRVNVLLEVLIKIDDKSSVCQLFEEEEKRFVLDYINPYNFSELGRYYKLKGGFLVSDNQFDKGMKAYLQSMSFFSRINARKDIMECSEDIYTIHYEQGRDIKLELLGMLKEVYNRVNSSDDKE